MTKKIYIHVNEKLFIKKFKEDNDITTDEAISKYSSDNYDMYNSNSPNTKKLEIQYKSLNYYSSINAMSNTLYIKGVFIKEIYDIVSKDLRFSNDEQSLQNRYFKYLKNILQDNFLITFDINGNRMLTGFIDRVNMNTKTVKSGGNIENNINFDIVVYDATFDLVKCRLSDGKDVGTVDNILDVINEYVCKIDLNDADKNSEGGVFIYPLYVRLQKTLTYSDLDISNSQTRGNIGQSMSDFLQDLAKIKGLVIRGNGMGGIDIYSLNIDDNTYNIIFDNFKKEVNDDLTTQKKIEDIKNSNTSITEKRELISELLNKSTYNLSEKSKLETEVNIRKVIKNSELISFYNNISFNNNYDYYRISEGSTKLDNAYSVKVSKSFKFNRNIIGSNNDIIDVINNINNINIKKEDVILPNLPDDFTGYSRRNRGYSKIIAEGEIVDGFNDDKFSLDLINQNNKIASLEDTVLIIEIEFSVFSNLELKIGDFIEISNNDVDNEGNINSYFIPYDFDYQSIIIDENGDRIMTKINYYLLSKIEISKNNDGERCKLHLSYRDSFTKYAMRESK